MAPTGPLSGVRVLELSSPGPGPHACMLLAEMGADVLRLDRIGGAQITVPAEHDLLHRSRPCAAVDLKHPSGLATALQLVDRADVLVEGLRPGVVERLGLGPDVCTTRNPRLVFARMTGWGQTGPLAGTVGHDINYLALSGALHAVGPADHPVPPLNLVADFGGGSLYLVVGVLAALLERVTSGRGQVVDAAMVDGAASLLTMTHALLQGGMWRDERAANSLDGGAPFYGTYACSDGRHIAVGAMEPRFFAALLAGLGLTGQLVGDQHDERSWPAHRAAIAAAFAGRTRDEWTSVFAGSDACVTPVLSLEEAPSHPHHAARGTYVPGRDGRPQPGSAPRFSRTPSQIRSAPHAPGEDTRAALGAWGVCDEELQELCALGVIDQLV
ncbi:MAG: L-carnitine dehydratase/bile acid-inducible protein [Frankiales bacterium]|nr:L-carnitine dehydratase/bile acid-inducible protein [Frankiales bacterium]